jgi:hypothetical protein
MISKISKYFFLFLFFIISISTLRAQQLQNIKGKVSETLVNLPIENATIQIDDKQAISDKNGFFEVFGVSLGRKEIKVSCVGYKTQIIKEVLVESGKESTIEITLSPVLKELGLLEVKAASSNPNGAISSIESINMEQVFRYPATFFDPARLAFSFAGVANANDQANAMVVRGHSPNSLQWRLEGVEIVNPNHLSNAGTLSDGPSQSAGGTNMLSAQLLGNMNFMLGAHTSNYGNAIGGIMDMSFRNGNTTKREHTIQTGLIGIDLSTEGPFSKKSKASYLINYRYSFTGLLGLMGVDFGGESIKFQDLSANIYLPTKKAGEFSIFSVVGTNSNIFKSKNVDYEMIKDYQDIDYVGKTVILGVKNTIRLNSKMLLKNVAAYSSLNNSRESFINFFQANELFERNSLIKSILSFSSILNYRFSESSSIRTGLLVNNQKSDIFIYDNGKKLEGSVENTIIEPFLEFNAKLNDKLNASVGVHYAGYVLTNSNKIEPRFSILYDINNRNSIGFNYGLYSQQQSANYYLIANTFKDSKNFKVQTSNQLVVSYKHKFTNQSKFKAEMYYINIANAIISQNPAYAYYSSLNESDNFNRLDNSLFESLTNKGQGMNYGIELSYQKLLDKGWFYNVNATVYKSLYKALETDFVEGKFDGNYIANFMIGKEWNRSKSRILGINTRLVYVGGYNDYQINTQLPYSIISTVFDYGNPLSYKYKDYFRPDFRIYLKKSRTKYSRTISIDLQNFAGIKNEGFRYFEPIAGKIVVKNQLGIIPMFNYRWEF